MVKKQKKSVSSGNQDQASYKIIIIDDDESVNRLIQRTLDREGFRTESARTGKEAFSKFTGRDDEILLLDYQLPDMTGKEVLRSLSKKYQRIHFVIMTGHGDEKIAVDMMKLGARDYIIKRPNFIYLLTPKIKRVCAEIDKERHFMQTEESLKESEEKYKASFNKSRDAILVFSRERRIVDVNQRFVELSGCLETELESMHLQVLFPETADPKTEERLRSMLHGKEIPIFEAKLLTKNKMIIPVEIGVTMLTNCYDQEFVFQANIRDISRRKQAEADKTKLEEQLRRSQKLETIGTLAGGIAHDFNNILTPIMGYADMALAYLPSTNPLRNDLEAILNGAYRAKDLVEQILLFSRQIEKERKPLGLHLIVKEGLKLIRPSIPTTIDIRQRIDDSCDKIMADPSQMHEVVVNLCTNAWQAMEEKGGTLTIELRQVEVDAATAKSNPNLKEGQHVRLTVSDTGTGMDDAILERIFEPFFTTKAVDKGTGMGLSVVHGIVRGHHGDILVYSEPGKGTTFHVYLPVTSSEKKISKKELAAIQGGEESILVVDDEEVVLNVVQKMLKRLGYKVDICNRSIDALKTIRRHPEKYHLVISDLTMPDMTGLILSERLQQIRPEFPTIIMTGFGESLQEDILHHYGVHEVTGKPIIIRELAAVIRKVLDT